jgi:L-amino acid N-acyltransferase YncA
MHARTATIGDSVEIAAIYNQGIAERIATFETEPRRPEDVTAWLEARHPVVVVADENGKVQGFAAAFPYRTRPCYTGVKEFSVYVSSTARRRGVGLLALAELERLCAMGGAWKLLSRVFVENEASRHLLARAGFREVGIYERHGRLEGQWRDCVIVERLIGEGLDEPAPTR